MKCDKTTNTECTHRRVADNGAGGASREAVGKPDGPVADDSSAPIKQLTNKEATPGVIKHQIKTVERHSAIPNCVCSTKSLSQLGPAEVRRANYFRARGGHSGLAASHKTLRQTYTQIFSSSNWLSLALQNQKPGY